MALQPTPIPLRFPLGGVSENAAYSGDPKPLAIRPEHTLNMRPFDALERRARGGQRTGLAKWSGSRPSGGSDAIQLIDGIVESIDPNQDAEWGAQQTPGTAYTNANEVAFHPGGDYIFVIDGGSDVVRCHNWSESTGMGPLAFSSAAPDGTNNLVDLLVSPDGASVMVLVQNVFSTDEAWFFATFDTSSGFGSWAEQTSVTYGATNTGDISPDGTMFVADFDGGLRLHNYSSASGVGTLIDSVSGVGPSTDVHFHPDNNAVVWNEGVTPISGGSFGSTVAFTTETRLDGGCRFNPDGDHVAYVDGSNIYARTWDGSSLGARFQPSGSAAVGEDHVRWKPDGTVVGTLPGFSTSDPDMWLWSGTSFGAQISAPSSIDSSQTRGEWSPGEGWFVLAAGSSGPAQHTFSPAETIVAGRRIRLVVVAGGGVYQSTDAGASFSQPTSGSGAFIATDAVRGTPAFQDYYFVDGTSDYQYLDVSVNEVKDWDAAVTSGGAGTMPAGSVDASLGCSIIALYRGRIVMAGLREDPQNWFMSASGDPFDWDYSPATTSATQAVSGNNSDVGLVGDVLNALIPFSDDLLFLGGDATLWVMRGDPAAGGEIDSVSRAVGVVGPDAWCIDEMGTLWFFGNNGLYRIRPQSFAPELVSAKKLDKTFANIDTAANEVRLVYDRVWQVVHIFINPLTQASSPVDHWVYDRRTDSFWRDQYPVEVGPRSVYLFDGPDPDDRAVILGGFDGYIREFSDAATDDDGSTLTSYVRLPMIHPKLPAGQFQLVDHQVTLDDDGGASTQLSVFRGRTPEQAAHDASAEFTRTLAAGRNLPARTRIRANALQFELRNAADETWAYEDGTALVASVGRQRAGL